MSSTLVAAVRPRTPPARGEPRKAQSEPGSISQRLDALRSQGLEKSASITPHVSPELPQTPSSPGSLSSSRPATPSAPPRIQRIKTWIGDHQKLIGATVGALLGASLLAVGVVALGPIAVVVAIGGALLVAAAGAAVQAAMRARATQPKAKTQPVFTEEHVPVKPRTPADEAADAAGAKAAINSYVAARQQANKKQ